MALSLFLSMTGGNTHGIGGSPQAAGIGGWDRRHARAGEARFAKDDAQRMKHFGIYQQQEGNMVRLKIPGGRFSTEQYLAVSDIALRYANRQFMITTRQDVQFHTVRPQHLRDIISILDSLWTTTQGACGDVVRNVTSCPVSDLDGDVPLRYPSVDQAALRCLPAQRPGLFRDFRA